MMLLKIKMTNQYDCYLMLSPHHNELVDINPNVSSSMANNVRL